MSSFFIYIKGGNLKEQKNKKGEKINYIRFNYSEEFITNIEKPTKKDLKTIFKNHF